MDIAGAVSPRYPPGQGLFGAGPSGWWSSSATMAATRPRQTGHWKDHVEDVIFAQAEHRQTCLQWRMTTSRGFDRQMTQSPLSGSPEPSMALDVPRGFGIVPYIASMDRRVEPHCTICFTTCTASPSPSLRNERCAVTLWGSAESARRSRTMRCWFALAAASSLKPSWTFLMSWQRKSLQVCDKPSSKRLLEICSASRCWNSPSRSDPSVAMKKDVATPDTAALVQNRM
mmetsp:Transcript_14466/g.41252  ORF Transcript_14466/g.41252 Transcript_14466/m.41252 type:complete len:229 (+) Transcript_14466:107-793(+)